MRVTGYVLKPGYMLKNEKNMVALDKLLGGESGGVGFFVVEFFPNIVQWKILSQIVSNLECFPYTLVYDI